MMWLRLLFFFLFDWLATGASNSQLAQLFLQTLAMQTNGRRRSRDIPPVVRKLFGQIRHLELALRLAKILFAQSIVVPVWGVLLHQRFTARDFLRQIRHVDFFAAA